MSIGFVLILHLGLENIVAQTMIEGRVSDFRNVPLANVFVGNLNSREHAHTDDLGYFVLENTVEGDTIQFKLLGFQVQSVVISETSPTEKVNVTLYPEAVNLEAIEFTKNTLAFEKIMEIDLKLNPVNSSQEILRKVPGLFIAQHAGGGKAEQIFLRGFDIDHGTDVAISLDDMPVNMVSHAHGQGYADMHFVIPEVIKTIHYGKGPYDVDKGNFATAGYVNYETKDKLDVSSMGLEYGLFNTIRRTAHFNLLENNTQNAYVASEYLTTDGPFDASQAFNRINIMGKFSSKLSKNSNFSLLASHFSSKWDASGQIPQRAVENGTINRFGAVDSTEGGETQRSNIQLIYKKRIKENLSFRSIAYLTNYKFNLYSNFTFFNRDSINGDQIQQFENRTLAGVTTTTTGKIEGERANIIFKIGGGFRYDNVDNIGLAYTKNRKNILNYASLGNIDETNIFSYLSLDFDFGKWLLNVGGRMDNFNFNYVDLLDSLYSTQQARKILLSTKLNLRYTLNNKTQFFLKTGRGFHSNDTRVSVAQNGVQVLPSAYGADLGLVSKVGAKLFTNMAVWYLYSEQEFVYVGDEAIIENVGMTQRLGYDLGLRYELSKWLFLDLDGTYNFAEALAEPNGQNHIPLAPVFTATGGLSIYNLKNVYGGLRYRYLGDRPANEDYSITAEGYFVLDANLNYNWNEWVFGINVQNLLNTQWNEAQFATESRLKNETEPVEELHFTPGTPFYIAAKVLYTF